MPVKVVHIEKLGNVTFFRNRRSKSIRMSIRPGKKIMVSYPFHISFSAAADFAQKHAEWAIRQQFKIETSLPKFSDTPVIRTRFHQINLVAHPKLLSVRQEKNSIDIFYPEQRGPDDPEIRPYIQKILNELYRWEAKKYLPPRLLELSGSYGFVVRKISIRNNRTNWGSCSSGNHISLNLQLMRLPDHLIDYVILHELVHTRVKNHGPEFWKMLDTLTGNQAKELARELKKYRAKIV
jgi:hypothetical protein